MQFKQLQKIKPEKFSLDRDLNPWPCDYRSRAQSTQLSNQLGGVGGGGLCDRLSILSTEKQ